MANRRKTLLCSSLEKVFPDTDTVETEFTAFSMFKNEKKSFQFAVEAKKGETISFSVVSPLQNALRFFCVKMIPAGANAPKDADDYYIAKDKDAYPDLLLPLAENAFTAEYDGLNAVWVEIQSDTDLPVGQHKIQITVCVGAEETALQLTVEVFNATLPKQDLIYTNWFHTDCLAQYYGVEVFSDEYWRITENFLRRACVYGMNCVLTPLFTPPLDTKIGGERPTVQLVDVTVTGKDRYSFGFANLEKWLEMCDRCGIAYYEMSHLFTQWGARHAPKIVAQKAGETVQIFGWNTRAAGKPYKRFLEQFAKAILQFIDEKGIREKCLFHISDEPNKGMLRPYKKASKIVHEYFTDVKIIDALSDYKLYEKGLVETPIPANNHIEPFIGKVPELWTYYCCSQGKDNVSNRFFAMPSARNRILGAQLYKFNVKGFLHWGYNFYFLQYSKGLIDPYKVTDAGGAFYSGDSFVVYPAKDGTPYNSLRLNVFYDAFQDMLALKLLESKIGREKTLAVLEKDLKKPITFSEYPHGAKWILEMRERVNRAIIQAE
ncbi:MAG: DUF4091 domain-containing protein [Candidatus Fimenecus sp.]